MKAIRIFIFTLITLLFGCDNIKQNHHDMSKYLEIKPFIIDSTNFKGNLNIDNSNLKFSFDIEIPHPLFKIDSIADINNWILIDRTRETRTYVKDIKNYPADLKIDTLTIGYNEKKSRLFFNLY